MSLFLKGVGRRSGDGWKDVTVEGEIVFVYGRELPRPYRAGQFQRVGNVGWTASREQYDFMPASLSEILRLLPTIWRDRSDLRRYAFRWVSQ